MGLREMRGGEQWWILNTTAYGASGALLSRQVPLGWGCERTSEKAGILSQASLDLLWGIEPRSNLSMICGVGTQLLR
jgi:hypothetical protein